MAVPYYITGTATLAVGSTTMTGQGTVWLGWVRPGDLVIPRQGTPGVVASVVSNTQITLLFPFQGTAQAAQSYTIMRTPDDVFTQTMVRDLLQKLGDSTLFALAGLPAAPRRGIRFDATGIAETFPFTDKAKALLGLDLNDNIMSLLGAADYADARNKLGVAPKQANTSDTTAGAGLIVGAFGIGGDGIAIPGGNYNNATTPGNYYGAGGGAINGPPADAVYGPLNVSRRGTILKQVAGYGSPTIANASYERFSTDNGATWSAWSKIVTIIQGTWTPTINPYAGSWGSAPTLNHAWYRLLDDKLTHYSVGFRVGTVGGATTAIRIGMPFTPAANHAAVGSNFSAGIALTGLVQTSGLMDLYTYNAMFPANNNANIAITGTYLRA